MAVVINEFEVLPAPSPAQVVTPAQPAQEEEGRGLASPEVEEALRRQVERAARLWAH